MGSTSTAGRPGGLLAGSVRASGGQAFLGRAIRGRFDELWFFSGQAGFGGGTRIRGNSEMRNELRYTCKRKGDMSSGMLRKTSVRADNWPSLKRCAGHGFGAYGLAKLRRVKRLCNVQNPAFLSICRAFHPKKCLYMACSVLSKRSRWEWAVVAYIASKEGSLGLLRASAKGSSHMLLGTFLQSINCASAFLS